MDQVFSSEDLKNLTSLSTSNGLALNITVQGQTVTKWFSSNISNTKECFSTLTNTEKGVENITCFRAFLIKLGVFGNVMKHSLECLIYLFYQNETYGENREIKSYVPMLTTLRSHIQTTITVLISFVLT